MREESQNKEKTRTASVAQGQSRQPEDGYWQKSTAPHWLWPVDRAFARIQRFLTKRLCELRRLFQKNPDREETCNVAGLIFRLDLAETTDFNIYSTGQLPGGADRQLVVRALSEGDIVFDVGANVGYYSVPFARAVRPGGRVVSFEPNPRMADRLTDHFARNGIANAEVIRSAVGDSDGFLELHVPEGGDPGQGTVVTEWQQERSIERYRVPVTTLDSFVEKAGTERIDLMKIDVEGFEPNVLAGAGNLIRRFRPRMLIEVYSAALAANSSSAEALMRQVQDLGYDIYKVAFNSENLMRIRPDRDYGAIYDIHCFPIT